uniref:Ras family GTPase n=1 Tax=Iridovirus LCIVAC01 TaxID=2506607 RepID=A0A481YQN3_9VIRU|nr:MAG: Ras family GTPase [Iridovirus LCIVAC01]
MSSYKIVIVGDANVGKTSYVERLITGNFIEDYEPTLGVSVRQYKRNGVTYHLWDCAGNPKLGDEKMSECFSEADGAIVMFDAFKHHTKYLEKWTSLFPGIPICFCTNKQDWAVKAKYQGKYPCYPMSVKDGYNIEKPFEYFEEYDFYECEDCGLVMNGNETICKTCGWNSITSQSKTD